MASILQKVARIYLILQAANNILFGAYCVYTPSGFGDFAGGYFMGVNDGVLRGVGLGMVGVGVYGLFGALKNERDFFWITALLRAGFAGIMASVGESGGVVGYEVLTAGMAVVAAMAKR